MNDNKITEYEIIKRYKGIMVDALQYSFPLLTQKELSEAIDYSIISKCKNAEAIIDNNYNKRKINSNVLEVLEYIIQLEPIVTSSGVLFKKHKDSVNPLAVMIKKFVDLRDEYKHTMFKYPKGSEMFEKYNLFQLLCKLDANAVYGALGACTCMYYNVYVAEAVTRQGRSSISCSMMLFEALLANNIKFNSLNEVIVFIHNVVGEKSERQFKDDIILDRNITLGEAFYKIMNTTDMTLWVPTERESALVWEYMQGLSQEDLNRLYYKNNIYTFADLPVVSNILIKILCELKEPFMNPNKPPKYIKEDLDTLVSLMYEYVYYHHFPIDKLDRIEYMQRDIVIITDTDSTIISFDAWYRFLLEKVYDMDMPIKHQKYEIASIIKADEFGETPLREMCIPTEPEYDYNFYTDEFMEKERLIEMGRVIPQDSLKYSIINIIAYICSDLVVDYLDRYCDLNYSNQENKKCELIMKNEFYFLRVLLTANRRNYADAQLLQEGNIVPEGSRLAIMGLPINKSTLSESIKAKLQKILYEDVLISKDINQVEIMKKLVKIEREIYDNIMSGKTDYYKPDNIGTLNSYKKSPLEVNGIVAAMIYNELRDEDMPAINLEERNKIIKVKLNVTKKNIYKIKDKYPETFDKISKLLNHPLLGKKVKIIGFPTDVKIPDWVLEFVDVKQIINDSLRNFPVESIGLNRLGNDSVNFSNIIKL